jgi:hypothetical protein
MLGREEAVVEGIESGSGGNLSSPTTLDKKASHTETAASKTIA